MVAAGKLVNVPFSRIKQKLSVTVYDWTGRTPSEIIHAQILKATNSFLYWKSPTVIPAFVFV
ncbi:hypothetical protein MTR_1g019900 [Medicago truncatula]|uniref:Uncharacterized protein n=1 Tax=Medicago truncatula TaxID=3880 RepID=G7I4G6_MEDTR|nr:hypothetical protein MTR_1g019900 [Medicago truncatula]